MVTPQPPKILIESHIFATSRTQITSNTELFDDILNGVTFLIASEPSEFPLVDDNGTRTAKIKSVNEIPALTLFF